MSLTEAAAAIAPPAPHAIVTASCKARSTTGSVKGAATDSILENCEAFGVRGLSEIYQYTPL